MPHTEQESIPLSALLCPRPCQADPSRPTRSQWAHAKSTDPAVAFEDFVYSSIGKAEPSPESDVAGARRVAEPDQALFETYGRWIGEWEKLEQEVERRCAGGAQA